jgi:RNase P/RNase MRP subunit p29
MRPKHQEGDTCETYINNFRLVCLTWRLRVLQVCETPRTISKNVTNGSRVEIDGAEMVGMMTLRPEPRMERKPQQALGGLGRRKGGF